MINEDTLIYDIETRTYGKPDSTKDRLKIFGCYSYKTKKTYLLTKKEDIQKIINAHKYLVGFNNLGTKLDPGYDNPILAREGIVLDYKIFIDLMVVFKSRASQMKIKEGMLGDLLMEYNLNYITKTLGLVNEETGKQDIDYKLFQKDIWTTEEVIKIKEYTKRDILITKLLYEWVEKYFEPFIPFLNEEDTRKKVYINASIAKFAYKAICKAMNWNEEYNKDVEESDKIGGGYVAYPAGEMFEGNIFCLDFNSLYPHIIIQCNLYGRIDSMDTTAWNGRDTWEVEGYYNANKLNGICELFINWYKERTKFKKLGDRKEYTLKIILNASYGIMNNAYYKLVYDKIAGGDCTRIGRQWIKYARKRFRENGYTVCYTDTDSIYVVDVFNDKEKLLGIKNAIIKEIKNTVPFPQDTFDMGIDDEIKYIYFFKGQTKEDKESDKEMDIQDKTDKPKGLMKKNYIYVTKDNRVVIKNLGIKKKSNSLLSRKIFWDYLVPRIKEGEIKFSKTYLRNIMIELLEKDLTLAAMRKDVGHFEQYKEKSPTCLSAQISQKYGSGIHFLIPNLKGVGAGKDKHYCTIEEFKQHNMTMEHIDLDNVWNELEYFIKPMKKSTIFDY